MSALSPVDSDPQTRIIGRLAMHPAVTTSETSRQCAHSHFRPQSNSNKLATLTPQLPNLSWVHQRYLMLGLVHSALPPELDLKTPRVGRAIKHTVRQRGISGEYVLVNIYLAMFPAHPSIPFVPPYSGVAHIDANTPNTSTSCYIDGTRGAFDYRRFPQLYNPRAPWRGFHDNLLTLEWQPNVCENLTVVDFFLWNQPGNPNAGGYWALHRLRELFLRREVMENEFTRLVHAANQARHPPQFCTGSPWDSFDMPFYDPLEWDDVRKWSNWIDGRDLLSNSLQYVAELKAFNRWFRTIVEPDLSSPREPSPIDMSLMGVWASTITQRAEWEFLRYNGVPVYIVTNIPDLNPLRSIVITGNLDGDERYRSNAFDATHSLESYWLIRHKKEYPLLPDLNLDLCADYLPTMLHRVVLKEPLPNSKLNSHLYTWHSPLYQVVDLNRFDSDQVQRQIDQIDTRQAIDNIFPVTTTQYKPLDTDADRHPLLDVLGISKARASKLTRYEECYDKGKNCYYPIRLGKHTSGDKEQINACDYCFFFPSLRVEIISEFPFPGRSISFKRRSDSDDGLSDSQFEVDNRPRRYFTTNQETRKPLRFAFTWEPSLDILAARAHTGTSSTKHLHEILQCPNDKGGFCSIPTLPSHQANTLQLHVFDDLIYEAIRHLSQLEHETALSELQRIGGELSIPTDYSQEIAILERRQTIKLREISWRCNYILFRDIASGRIDPLPPAKIEERELEMANQILCLIAQRMIVDSRVQMRLFKSARGDDAISQVAFPWHIPDGGSECICYPVRFGMLHGDVLPEHLLAMLGQILDIRHYDVVVYASYQEIDSTQTIELGFRYCEDALYCRALLHGVLADDRYLEVNFLRYMTMEINAVSYPLEGLTTLHRTPKQRLQSVISICAVPGIPAKLLDDAYTLERQLTTWVQEKGHLTLDAVNDLKKEERMPMYDVLTEIESLLDMGNWKEHYRPLFAAQTVSVGRISAGLAIPPLPLLRQSAMVDGIRWDESPVKSGRPDGAKGPNAKKNKQKHKPPPPEVADTTMIRSDLKSLLRAIEHRAETLREIWKPSELQLPQLNIPQDYDYTVAHTVELFKRLWDWQDQCLEEMCRFHNETVERYDFESFEDVFGGTARLHTLRGPFYTACYKALQERSQRLNSMTESIH